MSTTPDRLLSIKEVCATLGIRKTKVWSDLKAGRFPQPVRLGARTTRWKESDIIGVISAGF